MKRLLKLAVILLSIAYPFLIYWGLQHFSAAKLLPLILIILGLRWIVGGQSYERILLVAILGALLLVAMLGGYQLGLKFYPVMVNLGFLLVFAGSLIFPPPVVERIARLREPELPPGAISYTLKVTWIWTGFFVVNGLAAAYTAVWTSDEIWVLYNGFVAYLLIGSLVAGEWLVRQRVMRRNHG